MRARACKFRCVELLFLFHVFQSSSQIMKTDDCPCECVERDASPLECNSVILVEHTFRVRAWLSTALFDSLLLLFSLKSNELK